MWRASWFFPLFSRPFIKATFINHLSRSSGVNPVTNVAEPHNRNTDRDWEDTRTRRDTNDRTRMWFFLLNHKQQQKFFNSVQDSKSNTIFGEVCFRFIQCSIYLLLFKRNNRNNSINKIDLWANTWPPTRCDVCRALVTRRQSSATPLIVHCIHTELHLRETTFLLWKSPSSINLNFRLRIFPALPKSWHFLYTK